MTRIPNRTTTLFICFLLFIAISPIRVLCQGFSPDITVALDGSGDFTKIQDAIDAVPDNSTTPTTYLYQTQPVRYRKVIVPATKTNIVMIGESRDETIMLWMGMKAQEKYGCNNSQKVNL